MRGTFVVILVILAVPAMFFLANWDRASLHYRLTYDVNVNGEIRTGSGVIRIVVEDTSKLPLLGAGYGSRATGEAVVVDLGDGRYLFSLLHSAATLPFMPFRQYYEGRDTVVDVVRALSVDEPRIELTGDQLPMLVVFQDINDPKSVRHVDPDNFAAVLGSGVRLESATLEITDADVTHGRVKQLLGWWLVQAQGIYDPPAFRIPNNSPRGYSTVGVTNFFQNSDWKD